MHRTRHICILLTTYVSYSNLCLVFRCAMKFWLRWWASPQGMAAQIGHTCKTLPSPPVIRQHTHTHTYHRSLGARVGGVDMSQQVCRTEVLLGAERTHEG